MTFNFDELVPKYLRENQVYSAGKSIDELKREKKLDKISKLASNENPIGPSTEAIKMMSAAIWKAHRYPDMYALKLRNKLASLYDLNIDNIILGNGSEGIMAYVCRTFLRPTDEVLTSENTFIGFYVLAKGAGAKLVCTPMTVDYRYDVEKMVDALSEKTKIIYIANPNNPTGRYMNKQEFDYLMEHVSNRCLVIIDEAYFEFAQGKEDYPDSMDYRYDNVITTRTFSKAYGLSGVRIGYGFGHKELIKYLYKAKLPFSPNLIAQSAGIGALKDVNHLKRTLRNNSERIRDCTKFFGEFDIEAMSSVANFLTICSGSLNASEECFQLLQDKGVIIRPLGHNGMPEFLRISMGSYDEMNHFYQAFEEIIPILRHKHPKFGKFLYKKSKI